MSVLAEKQELHLSQTPNSMSLMQSSTWSQPETQGKNLPARHGHIVAAVGLKIYIHGGMAGDKFHNDMYTLDTRSMKWEKVQTKGDIPPGVAAHSTVVLGKNIYIFGGTADGASNSMYRFNTEKCRWIFMKFEGDMPPNRLDHSMCVLPWKVCGRGMEMGGGQQPHSLRDNKPGLCIWRNGHPGVIHNDCVVTVVT
ncbi:hypothetical protein F7725_015539 [Dissostichus mawsoni]|uniref:Rab9 effector protein with kelch motifs n=1 Tax=Dissostichus mawsoni TaxID=36200 RepID=A0A7J5YHS2_DISMA|nr:hypothetical protein F7725_015539 [Dissostichus mawsoni]